MKTQMNMGESFENEHDLGPRVPVFPANEVARLVGCTPIPKYATWDDHRREIGFAAEDAKVRLAR